MEPTNAPARTLYHTLGFVTYGIEPQAYFLDGEYWDSELMSLDLHQPGVMQRRLLARCKQPPTSF